MTAAGQGLPPEMSKYTLVRTVGQGAFGAALLVTTKTGLPLIAKELNITRMSPKEKEAVNSEITLLRTLKHPNIIRYEEFVQANAALYIVMEYADGGDLYNFIQKLDRPMSEEAVLYIFAQICLAIRHLHTHRVLHRDLKTQNIFLTKKLMVKLGDFGLATALRHTWQQAHSLCGTPNYFSPELVMGRPYNNKSDIWALGCILYEMLTKRFAFSSHNMTELMTKICYEQPPSVPASYSEGLQYMLQKMLSKEQAIRPSIDAIIRAHILKEAFQRIQEQLEQKPQQHQSGAMTPATPTKSPLDRSVGGPEQAGLQAVKSEDDMAALERDVLAVMQPERIALDTSSGEDPVHLTDDLLMEIHKALTGEEAGPEEFGDEQAYTTSDDDAKGGSPEAPQLNKEASFDGEIEGLLEEFTKLDKVIAGESGPQ